jgi:antitoxin PrlF
MEATVAERGQITLPKAVRDALGLTKGSVLKVELEGSRIILRKSVDDAISRARGRFKLDGFESTDAAIEAVRGHVTDEASGGADGSGEGKAGA